MNTSSNRIVRVWRTILPHRGSVARPSDRFQAGLLVLFILIALAALPFVASLGSETYARQQTQSAQELKERTPAVATLLVDAPPPVANSRAEVSADPQPTAATWVLADGTRRTGQVGAERGAVKGSTVSIWVDGTGDPVARPLTPAGAAIDAITMGVGLWVGLLVALVFFYQVIAYVLDHFRYAQWQREWFHALDSQSRQ